MNDSSQQPGLEVTDPNAYLARILDTIKGREPLEVYAQTPGGLRKRITDNPVEVLRRRPYPDRWTWTPLEIIGHLLDAEWAVGLRTRSVLCDDKPPLIGIGQDKWAATQKHNDSDPVVLVDDFSAMRAINLRFWRSIPTDQYNRVGLHNERGEESLGDMLKLYAAHDLYHLQQFDRYMEVLA